MRVYRVEDADGNGPYGWGDRGYVETWPDNDFDRHPTDERDGLGYRRDAEGFGDSGWRFGFTTLEQAVAWFDPPRQATLARYGYGLVAYEVKPDDVMTGNKQAVFRVDGMDYQGPVAWPLAAIQGKDEGLGIGEGVGV